MRSALPSGEPGPFEWTTYSQVGLVSGWSLCHTVGWNKLLLDCRLQRCAQALVLGCCTLG